MTSKDDLKQQAEAVGVPAEGKTKAELEEGLDKARAAGPLAGDTAAFEKKGKTVTGVQPLVEDDIPDAGR